MQFKNQQEIGAPAAFVFARITDFKRFEGHTSDSRFSFKRQSERPIHIGTRWDIWVLVRGRKRKFVAELSEMVPPRTVSYKSSSSKYEGVYSLTVVALGPEKCRLDMLLVVKPRNFATALVFNTIRLARRRINKRLRVETAKFADRLAAEYRGQT